MREAFGGEFMVRLLLVFIVLYVAFTAISLNYAKAFRVKNAVISYIEEKDVQSIDDINCQELGAVISNNQYHKTCKKGNDKFQDKNNNDIGYCCNGVIIKPNGVSGNKLVYEVNTYASFNLGAGNMLATFAADEKKYTHYVDGTWEITGKAYVRKIPQKKKIG